jgi:hypothetical protein
MARRLFNKTKLARTITIEHSFAEASESDRCTWLAWSPRRRLATVELWRQMNHADYDPYTARLPRVLEIIGPASR